MSAAIAQHLNVLESAIVRVEEWARVMFVVVKGVGARFVSKKVMAEKKISQAELADKVVAALSDKYGFGNLSVWAKKKGEKRIYIKNFGYIRIVESVDLYWLKGYKKEVERELFSAGDLISVSCEKDSGSHNSTVTKDGLVAMYGWREVADAQADVAREDWDI